MLKLIYYVPESHLESTKAAIFAAVEGVCYVFNLVCKHFGL